MKEELIGGNMEESIYRILLGFILGLFSILLIGTHVKINEYENELAEIRNEINIVEVI